MEDTHRNFKTEVKSMKKLMLAIILMTAFASITPAAADHNSIPIPECPDCTIDEVPLPPPSVPDCWPVCN